ncbi:hypothetical protein SAMN04489724_3663 [Algoriphagus locisalis]|uniref:Lipoprotein n=1 Tax=Algoriphagus locisalis TaxID=305507 RepID=A0A1I7D1J6_9BACT|nr:hypothetical protein [Algoriphagus locisalis]SFU05481.1 hypothetical protein SAMN04489724_3663 [Algoriphagus locisalis]
MLTKPYVYLILLCFFSACQSKNSTIVESKTDTLKVGFSKFAGSQLYGNESLTFIKTISEDTITFTYFDSLLSKKSRTYSLLKTTKGSYELLNNSYLGYVNKFIALDSILLLKYEFLDPPMDGDGAVILNPELGEIANYSYTWGNSFLISKFNGYAIPKQLTEILLSDSMRSPHYYYLKDYGNKE